MGISVAHHSLTRRDRDRDRVRDRDRDRDRDGDRDRDTQLARQAERHCVFEDDKINQPGTKEDFLHKADGRHVLALQSWV